MEGAPSPPKPIPQKDHTNKRNLRGYRYTREVSQYSGLSHTRYTISPRDQIQGKAMIKGKVE